MSFLSNNKQLSLRRDPARSDLGRRPREGGEGVLRALFWLGIVVVMFIALMEYVPKRYRVSEFEDAIREASERAGQRGGSAARIKSGLLWEAQQLDLPVTKDNLNVVANTSFVSINSSYVMPIEFPFYTWEWKVKHEIRRKVFRF